MCVVISPLYIKKMFYLYVRIVDIYHIDCQNFVSQKFNLEALSPTINIPGLQYT